LGGVKRRRRSVAREYRNDRGLDTNGSARHGRSSTTGGLTALFREGQDVVVEGMLRCDGTFRASNVLAKLDENDMTPEAAEAVTKSGHWQETSGNMGAAL
jgi:cytochrome c-type biogenesis protein CcmE